MSKKVKKGAKWVGLKIIKEDKQDEGYVFVDKINPFGQGSPAYECFELLVAGGTKADIVEKLGAQIKKLKGIKTDADTVFAAMMNRMGEQELRNFQVRKISKGVLVLDRKDKKEEEETKMSVKTAKKKVLEKVKRNSPTKQQSTKVVKKVKVSASKNGGNPFQPGFGIFLVYEVLSKGGTYNELLARVKGKFQKGQIGSSPKGRLDTVITIAGKSGQLKNFKIIRKGKGKAETLQIAKR